MAKNPLKLDDMDDDDKQPSNAKEPDAAPSDQQESTARQGDQLRPYCRRHYVLMKSVGSGGGVTRYQCPVPDCKEKEKRAQPRSVIPRNPMQCPHCHAQAIAMGVKKPTPVYCVVDFRRSTSGSYLMACPDNCGFHVRVPRPDVAIRARRMRSEEEISAR